MDQLDPRLHAPFKNVTEPLLATCAISGWKAVGAGAGGCAIVLLKDGL